MNSSRRARGNCGFSLIEAILSLTLLIIISSATFSALLACQKIYLTVDGNADVHSGLRGATEMLAQEIGQSGAMHFTGTTLSSAVSASSTAQTVTLGSTSGLFVGEKVLVG